MGKKAAAHQGTAQEVGKSVFLIESIADENSIFTHLMAQFLCCHNLSIYLQNYLKANIIFCMITKIKVFTSQTVVLRKLLKHNLKESFGNKT